MNINSLYFSKRTRKSWNICPAEKVKKNKKAYNRKSMDKELKEIKNEYLYSRD